MSTCFLHVPDPDDQPFDDDEPNKPIAPGDRWCSLWAPRDPGGPRLPCHPSIEGTADEWLLIAGAIEAGAPRAFGRVAFAPAAGGGELWSPHNSTGDRDHVRLTTAELVELAADIRAKLATPNPDVIASTPRPTVADQPPCKCRLCAPATNLDDVRACVAAAEQAAAASPPGEHDFASLYAVAGYTRSMCDEIERLRARPAVDRADITAALETYRLAAIAEHAASTSYGSIGAVRAAVVTLQDARDAVLAAVATTPPAIPPDLRALLEEQRRLTRAVHDDVEDEEIREAWHDALEEVNAWTRAHAGASPAPLTDDELASMWRRQIGTSPSPNGMTLMRSLAAHAGGGR